MQTGRIYIYYDRKIVSAIPHSDSFVTKELVYKQFYPLFRTSFCKYSTDCKSGMEFMREIYTKIMAPLKSGSYSKPEDSGSGCTLAVWLKIIMESYRYRMYPQQLYYDENGSRAGDRGCPVDLDLDFTAIKQDAAMKIFAMTQNNHYRRLSYCVMHTSGLMIKLPDFYRLEYKS